MAVREGQGFLDFAGDLHRLLSEAPGKDHAVTGKGYRAPGWYHHLAGMMIVACMSSLEEELGSSTWNQFNYRVDEFEVIRCIRNAYVHCGSDISKGRDAKCAQRVSDFLNDLKAKKIIGSKKGMPVSPYFELNGSVVKLNGSAIRRMQSLYVGLLEAAGRIVA